MHGRLNWSNSAISRIFAFKFIVQVVSSLQENKNKLPGLTRATWPLRIIHRTKCHSVSSRSHQYKATPSLPRRQKKASPIPLYAFRTKHAIYSQVRAVGTCRCRVDLLRPLSRWHCKPNIQRRRGVECGKSPQYDVLRRTQVRWATNLIESNLLSYTIHWISYRFLVELLVNLYFLRPLEAHT